LGELPEQAADQTQEPESFQRNFQLQEWGRFQTTMVLQERFQKLMALGHLLQPEPQTPVLELEFQFQTSKRLALLHQS
jgi:hypothetical protein